MKSWLIGGVPLSYLHDPSSIPGYASLFFSELDHEIYCINKVILINVKAAAVAPLVKACDSFAQHQGSIPTSLKFFFFQLDATTWSHEIGPKGCACPP